MMLATFYPIGLEHDRLPREKVEENLLTLLTGITLLGTNLHIEDAKWLRYLELTSRSITDLNHTPPAQPAPVFAFFGVSLQLSYCVILQRSKKQNVYQYSGKWGSDNWEKFRPNY